MIPRPIFRLLTDVVLTLVIVVGGVTEADASSFTLTVQPIQLCNSAGSVCGNATRTLFEDITDKILAQAGIDVEYLPWARMNNDNYLVVDMLYPGSAVIAPEAQQVMDLALAINNPAATLAINLFFSTALDDDYYGMGCGGPFYSPFCTGRQGIFIDDMIFADPFRGGLPRWDTLAHEMGHVLNLEHSSGLNRVMTPSIRHIPTSLDDVAPDGLGWDLLTDAEIRTVQQSHWLTAAVDPVPVPEPATLSLLIAGLVSTRYARWHRSKSGR